MSEHDSNGPTYRKIGFESTQEDTRTIVEMLRDATIASPDGHIHFNESELARYAMLESAEQAAEVVVAAERFTIQAVVATAMASEIR